MPSKKHVASTRAAHNPHTNRTTQNQKHSTYNTQYSKHTHTHTHTHITSHHITSHHITSHHITSRHITSHHITSHHITSHHRFSHRHRRSSGGHLGAIWVSSGVILSSTGTSGPHLGVIWAPKTLPTGRVPICSI